VGLGDLASSIVQIMDLINSVGLNKVHDLMLLSKWWCNNSRWGTREWVVHIFMCEVTIRVVRCICPSTIVLVVARWSMYVWGIMSPWGRHVRP
jgi:hypothetical protein